MLTTGIKSVKEIAEWMGIRPQSFSQKKQKKLKELRNFCDFELTKSGKINILEVFNPVYTKPSARIRQAIEKAFNEEWNWDDVDTCIRVGQAIYASGVCGREYEESTIINYVRLVKKEKFGTGVRGKGLEGTSCYQWGKKVDSHIEKSERESIGVAEAIENEIIKATKLTRERNFL